MIVVSVVECGAAATRHNSTLEHTLWDSLPAGFHKGMPNSTIIFIMNVSTNNGPRSKHIIRIFN
jgi:hypothetical protein